MRTRALIIIGAVVGVIIIVVAIAIGFGQNGTPPKALAAATPGSPGGPSPAQGATPADEPVPTSFKTEQRQPFEAPVELRSADRQLRTAFTVEPTTFTVAGAKVKGYAYQGDYIGPTLRVHPWRYRSDRTDKSARTAHQSARPRDVHVPDRHL